MWERVRELQQRGVTVVLTTHDMEEAAALANRVGIIDHGQVLALDSPGTLMRSLPGMTTMELTIEPRLSRPEGALATLSRLPGVERTEQVLDSGSSGDPGGARGEDRIRLYVAGPAAPLLAPAASVLAEEGETVTNVSLGNPTLEDVFLNLTGRTLR